MKLTVTIDLQNDRLDAGTLLRALPLALESVARATSAGVAATGVHGMDVEPPGVGILVKVHFGMEFAESGERLPSEVAGEPIALP